MEGVAPGENGDGILVMMDFEADFGCVMVFNFIVIGFVAPSGGDDGDDDVGHGGRDLLLREGGGRPSRREDRGGPGCRWNQLSSRRLVTNPRASPDKKVKDKR